MDVMSEVAQISGDSLCGVRMRVCFPFYLCIPSLLGNLGQNNLTLSNSKEAFYPVPSKFAEMIF